MHRLNLGGYQKSYKTKQTFKHSFVFSIFTAFCTAVFSKLWHTPLLDAVFSAASVPLLKEREAFFHYVASKATPNGILPTIFSFLFDNSSKPFSGSQSI